MKWKSGKKIDLARKEAYARPMEGDQWKVLEEARCLVGRQMAPRFFQDNELIMGLEGKKKRDVGFGEVLLVLLLLVPSRAEISR